MAALSDEARLYWPWLYCGSNGFGYFEMDYQKIIERSFAHFQTRPSRDFIRKILREYRDRSLLFLYRAPDGRAWAAWDSAAKQTYYTEEDKAAPRPPEPEFSNWKRLYQESKGRFGDELNLDEEDPEDAIDTKNGEIDITLKSVDSNPISVDNNPLSISISTSVSKHQSSSHQTSIHQSSRQQTSDTRESTVPDVPPLVPLPPSEVGIEGWDELIEAAANAQMSLDPDRASDLCQKHWRYLDMQERMNSIQGIRSRIECGQFSDPAYVPSLENYLRKKSWKQSLRPRLVEALPQSKPPSYARALASGLVTDLSDYRARYESTQQQIRKTAGGGFR